MVSYADGRGTTVVSLAALAALALAAALACSRRVEVENQPDGGVTPIAEAPRPDGGVPSAAGSGIEAPELLACAERPVQEACRGANDFACAFDSWVQKLVTDCQAETACLPDGWLEIETSADGCAADLRMEDPRPEFVACIVRQLTQFRCPCPDTLGSRFLGASNPACGPQACGTGELRCPPEQQCIEGLCAAATTAGGAAAD